MIAASLGPTLSGLAGNTGARLNEISYLFTARSLGYLLGALLAGQIYDRVRGHPVMVAALMIMALIMAAVPSISWLWLLIALLLILGTAEGTLDVGGNALIVWVHGKTVGPYMNGLHFSFGLGALISPLIVGWALDVGGGISWAYWILALLIVPAGIWLMRLPSPSIKMVVEQATSGPLDVPLLAMTVLFFVLYVGAEVSFGGWAATYAVELGLADAATAAYLTSIFWGALTVGRLVGIPISARMRPRTILLVELAGCIASVGLVMLRPDSMTALWIGAAGLGFFMASIFPVTLLWAERRMILSGRVTSWFFVGASIGAMSFPWLIGQFFEQYGPSITMVVIMLTLLAATAVFILLMLYAREPRLATTTES
jgi:FHS family Na+ dependent glucose MFS transporter 1